VSGYLARLAARASDRRADDALTPRLGPAIAAPGLLASEADATEESTLRVTAAAPRSQSPERSAFREQAAAAAPVDEPPAAPARTPRAREQPTRGPRKAAPPTPELDVADAPTPARAVDGSELQSPAPSAAPVSAPPTASQAERESTDAVAAEIHTLVELRPTLTPALVPPGASARASEPEHPPRVEVRIGRVEVRPPRPAPPAPAGAARSRPAPAPAPDPFARLAAARRYVDRVWG
jgi:hypothetical protein